MIINFNNSRKIINKRTRKKQILTKEEAKRRVDENGLSHYRVLGISDIAILIIGILEKNFRKYPLGFYKHTEDRADQRLLVGESWVTELGCSRGCFKKHFKEIGEIYLSPEEARNSDSPFGDKRYCSILNRLNNSRTLYLKNPAYNNLDLGISE